MYRYIEPLHDVDFLVSDMSGYRNLRQLLRNSSDLTPLLRQSGELFPLAEPIRADQYGIRTRVTVAGQPIKFEIVLEGRIELDAPGDEGTVCGVPVLTPLDMAASKLLANSDRWLDASVFCRDVIDLAMIDIPLPVLRNAVRKAEGAYGKSVLADLDKAIVRLSEHKNLLDRCMHALSIELPKAALWQRIRRLKQLL